MKEFKLKTPIELYAMIQKIEPDNIKSCSDILDYVGWLESHLSTYQMTLDQIKYQIESHNVNVTR